MPNEESIGGQIISALNSYGNDLKKGIKIPEITINIWDDFFDDGFVPEGEIQKTYAYVEENCPNNYDEEDILQAVCQFIQSLGFELKSYIQNDKIIFENITHVMLHKLIVELNKTGLLYNASRIIFTSES
jgi:hypothetical protein